MSDLTLDGGNRFLTISKCFRTVLKGPEAKDFNDKQYSILIFVEAYVLVNRF